MGEQSSKKSGIALFFVRRSLGLTLELKLAPERQAFASGPPEPPALAGPLPRNPLPALS